MFSFLIGRPLTDIEPNNMVQHARVSLTLLKNNTQENIKQVELYISTILDRQITQPDSEHYGLWPIKEYLTYAVPGKIDKNMTTYIGIPLFVILAEYSDILPAELVKRMEHSLSIACIYILNRNIHLQNSHITIAESLLTAACGERFQNREFTNYAVNLFQHFYHYTIANGSFYEYNSPHYDHNNLINIYLIKRYVKNELFLKLTEMISDSLWEICATHYHYRTDCIAGPAHRLGSFFLADTNRKFLHDSCTSTGKKNDELTHFDICPQKYRPYFNGTKYKEYSQQIISQGASYPYYNYSNVATTLMKPDYCIGSFSRGQCWVEQGALLGYFGTRETPFAIRVTATHDEHEYSSAQLSIVQHMNYVLGHTSFATNRADKHIDRDPTGGKITAKDLRVRFHIIGDVSKLSVSSKKNTLNIQYGSVRTKFTYSCAKFENFRPKIMLTKSKEDLCFDMILYRGKSIKLDFNDIKKAIVSWMLCISSDDIPDFKIENKFKDKYLITKTLTDTGTELALESYFKPNTHENIHVNNKQYIHGILFEKYVLRNSNMMQQYSYILSSKHDSMFNLELDNEKNISNYIQSLKDTEEKDLIVSVKEIFSLIYKKNITLMLVKRLAIQIISSVFDFYREKSLHFETIILNNSQLYQLRISSAPDTETVAYRVFELVNLMHSNYVSFNESQTDTDLINRITALIDEEYSNPDLSREYIAEKCGKSVYIVSRAFKKISNLKYIDYLTDIRIKHAKEYLKNSDLSLEEIALKVGYLNLSSFIRMFKRRTGDTPSNYRKK